MNMKLLGIFMLLLVNVIVASTCDTNISQGDMPITLNISNHIYCLNESVSQGSGSAFYLNAANITLNCNGFNITANDTGIYWEQDSSKLINCHIISTTNNTNSYGILMFASSNLIANSTFDSGSWRPFIYISDGGGNTFINITGSNLGGNIFHGFHIGSFVSGTTIINSNLSSVAGSALYFGYGSASANIINTTLTSQTQNGIEMYGSSSNTIANSSISTNNNLSAAIELRDDLNYPTHISTGNTFIGNTIIGKVWINNTSIGSQTFNSTMGNIYYALNGTPSWEIYNITDSNGDGWADGGSNLPFNSSLTGGEWIGTGADWHPYTEIDLPNGTLHITCINGACNQSITTNTTPFNSSISATPDEGYEFLWWSNDYGNCIIDNTSSNETTIELINGDCEITANFLNTNFLTYCGNITNTSAATWAVYDIITGTKIQFSIGANVSQIIGYSLSENVFTSSVNVSSNFSLCIFPDGGNVYAQTTDTITSPGYYSIVWTHAAQNYSSDETNYTVYLLNSSAPSKLTQIYVVDNTFAPMYNVSVKIEQINPSTAATLLIGLFLVDSFGSTTQALQPASQLYHFSVYDTNETLLQDYAQMAIPCTSSDLVCKLILVVNPIGTIGYVNTYNTTNGACNWNNATGYLNCTSVGEKITRTYLEVFHKNATSFSTVCTNSTLTEGSLSCTLNNTIETCYNFKLSATYSDSERRVLVAGEVCTYVRDSMGQVGLFAAFLLVCAFTGMGVYFGAPGALVGMGAGLLISSVIGFIPAMLFPVVIVLDIVLAIVAAYMVRGA